MSQYIVIERHSVREVFDAEHSKKMIDRPGFPYPSHSVREPEREVTIFHRAGYEVEFFSQIFAEMINDDHSFKPANEYKFDTVLISPHYVHKLYGCMISSVGMEDSVLVYDYMEIGDKTEEHEEILRSVRGSTLGRKTGIL